MVKTSLVGFKTLLEIDKLNEDKKAIQNTQRNINECEEMLTKKMMNDLDVEENKIIDMFKVYYDYQERFVGHANCQVVKGIERK